MKPLITPAVSQLIHHDMLTLNITTAEAASAYTGKPPIEHISVNARVVFLLAHPDLANPPEEVFEITRGRPRKRREGEEWEE